MRDSPDTDRIEVESQLIATLADVIHKHVRTERSEDPEHYPKPNDGDVVISDDGVRRVLPVLPIGIASTMFWLRLKVQNVP